MQPEINYKTVGQRIRTARLQKSLANQHSEVWSAVPITISVTLKPHRQKFLFPCSPNWRLL